MSELKTPGVYVEEVNAFPNSVVEVATAVPAFIGCTQKALRDNEPLFNKPTRISSFDEYRTLFGEGPATKFTYKPGLTLTAPFQIAAVPATQYYFYYAMRMFFDNGGGPCYIVSVGAFDDVTVAGGMAQLGSDALTGEPLEELKKELEPTMVVVPDAVLLGIDDWQKVCQQVLQHCATVQSRIGIFDVVDGYKKRNYDDAADVISGENGFRGRIASATPDGLNYGVAYYPWLNTSVTEQNAVDFTLLDDDSISQLASDLAAEALQLFQSPSDQRKLAQLSAKIATLQPGMDPKDVKALHQMLSVVSPRYQRVMKEILLKVNIVPPSGAMAGVYTRIDNAQGVFWAPANTTILSAVKPTINITDEDQQDLNVPLDGKAINALRMIPNRGLMIWGARTLDGNSQDWRYVNVRRTMIMLEQSLKLAAQAYVFYPNVALTWVTVKSMITNFLMERWKEGALAGSKPEDAFSVDVGLGSTMNSNDILDGAMKVMVKVALSHPAEFIDITFQQQMQKS
jgi:phage tail sheath protein FI